LRDLAASCQWVGFIYNDQKISSTNKMEEYMKRIGTVVCLAAISASMNVFAQSAGSLVVTPGIAWIDASRSSFGASTSTSIVGTFASPVSGQVHNALTGEVLINYFVTDNISIEDTVGIPPRIGMYAQGTAMPLGPGGPALALGNLHPLSSARAWSPMMLVKYNFGSDKSAFRPYAGIGVNYTWFSAIELNPTYAAAAHMFAGPGGSVTASQSPSWNPVFTAGASYNLGGNWYATASLTYLPLKANATVTSISAAGHPTLTAKTRITADPLLVFAGLGYRF
jgi:outer membrane protein